MKKLTSLKNPLFNTLERAEMKQVLGGMAQPTATAGGIDVTGHKDGTTTTDGTYPANPNDGADGGNA